VKKILLSTALATGLLFSTTINAQSDVATVAKAEVVSNIVNPQVYVQNLADQVLDILKNSGNTVESNPAEVAQSIEDALGKDVALSAMSTYLVGQIYSAATAAEQAAFNQSLLDFIGRLYETALTNFSADTTVTVYPTRDDYMTADRVQVNSMIVAGSSKIPVSYVLLKDSSATVNNSNGGEVSEQTTEVEGANGSVISESGEATGANGNTISWQIYDFNIDNSLSLLGNLQSQFRSMINGGNNTLSGLTETLNTHNQQTSS
jgi:ABC-type transporter MlaC component